MVRGVTSSSDATQFSKVITNAGIVIAAGVVPGARRVGRVIQTL